MNNNNKRYGVSRPSSGSWQTTKASSGSKVLSRSKVSASRTKAIFMIPTVEGKDEKYVKVVSGDVDRSKPSFA